MKLLNHRLTVLFGGLLLVSGLLNSAASHAAYWWDPYIFTITQQARPHLSGAKLPNGGTIPQETFEEKSQRLIPADEERLVIQQAFATVLMEKCSMEWQPTYASFFQQERTKGYDGKPLAYIHVLHSYARSYFWLNVKDKGCTPDARAKLSELGYR